MGLDITSGKGRRKAPGKVTPESLETAALDYLARYAAPPAHLRRLLLDRVARSASVHGTDPEAGARAVDALIARLLKGRLLDEPAYARAKAESLFRRGGSARAIRAKLAAKGVGKPDIEAALAALSDLARDTELAAALAFARRRRLGPYRAAGPRADARVRDLAAFGRQGFDFETARRVVDARDLADLEAEAGAVGPP